MLKFVRIAVQRTENSVFLTMVNSRRFGMGHRTALSMDRDFDPAANVNVLSLTLVRHPLLFSVACESAIWRGSF